MARMIDVDDWAADEYTMNDQVTISGAGLEFIARPGEHVENAPAPFYAELVTEEEGRKRVLRTYFHDFDQLGLHPRSRSRVDGLLKKKGHLFIDPECVQPRSGQIVGKVHEYPRLNDWSDTHHCLVLDPEFRPQPFEGADPFAKQKRIRVLSAC